ncbi:MAG: hypothetical protein AAF548_18210 [Actinomycetota bacterium]
MSEHDEFPGLGDALSRSAGSGPDAYSAADVAATVRFRRMRRAAAGGVAAVALVAGIAVGVTGDDDAADLDVVTPSTTITTAPPSSTTVPADGVCQAWDRNSVPTTAFEADIDGDGEVDTLHTYNERLYADLASGGGTAETPIPQRIFGLLDAADVDGDGLDELFVDIAGNTALWTSIVEYVPEDCSLRLVENASGVPLELLYSGTGNGCAPRCEVEVTCVADELGVIVESYNAVADLTNEERAALLAGEDLPETPPMRIETTQVRIADGVASEPTVTAGLLTWDETPEAAFTVVCSQALAADDGDVECAAPLEGRQPLPSSDRTAVVVDLDGDGAGDPFFYLADDELGGGWIQADRSTDGASTTAIRVDGLFGRETFLDAADLDGDGRNEGFLELAGNQSLWGVIVEIEGCELRVITTEDPTFDDGEGVFSYPIFLGGNGCAPTGCVSAVVCSAGVTGGLVIEIVSAFPTVSALDRGFDPDDDTPAADRTVEMRYDAYIIEDGVARPAPAQGLHPPTTGTVRAGTAEVTAWQRLNGVHCDGSTLASAECSVLPTIIETDDWKVSSQSFVPGAPVSWVVLANVDGDEVFIAGPGAIPAGDGEMATIDIGWTATLGSAGSNRLAGPTYYLQWTTAVDTPRTVCTEWSAWTTDLGPLAFSVFAQEVLGGTDLEWFGTPPGPWLDAEGIDDLAIRYLDELIRWGNGDGTPGIRYAYGVGLVIDGERASGAPSPTPEQLWDDLLEEDLTGIATAFQTFDNPSGWDTIIGYDEACGLDPLEWTEWGATIQITYTASDAAIGDGCGLAGAIHLYLYPEGSLATVRVDSVTG